MISKKYQELLVIIYIIIEIALLFFVHFFGIQDTNIKLLLYLDLYQLNINGTLFVILGFLSVNPNLTIAWFA